MLIRRSAGLLVGVLLIGLTPPLTGGSRADTARPDVQFVVDCALAQHISRGRSVKIALLSDGVASGVKSLKGKVEKEKDFVGTPRPKREVGTLMASLIIGGFPHKVLGGLASEATIMPVRVYADKNDPGGRDWQQSDKWADNISDGIRYAVDHGADVITAEDYDSDGENAAKIDAAVTYAQSKNVLIVAPVGTDSAEVPPYPTAVPGVIGIGVVTKKGRRDKKWTSRRSTAFVSVPGFKLPAIGPDNQLWTFWGNSVALALATGAVADIRSKYPKLTPAQIGQALSASARRPDGKGRYDTEVGFGYLNPAGALAEAGKLADKPAPVINARSSVPDKALLGGDRPDTIRAAPYHPWWIGGFGGLTVAGLVALGFATWLMRRRRSTPEPSEPAAA